VETTSAVAVRPTQTVTAHGPPDSEAHRARALFAEGHPPAANPRFVRRVSVRTVRYRDASGEPAS
jgi:hypothetical protein